MNYHNEHKGFPKEEHYAALLFESVYIPGDERSRTHPGHGYPSSNEPVVKYIQFKDKAEMVKWIGEQKEHTHFHVILSKPLTISRTINVDVE